MTRRARQPKDRVRSTHDRLEAIRDRGTEDEHRTDGAQGERVMSAEEQKRSQVTRDEAAASGYGDGRSSVALADQPSPVSGGSLVLVVVVVLLIAIGLAGFGIMRRTHAAMEL